MINNAESALHAGITKVRDMESKKVTDLRVRDAILTGLIINPQMLCVRQLICIMGGQKWQFDSTADGPDEDLNPVLKQILTGTVHVKLLATGGLQTRGGRALGL